MTLRQRLIQARSNFAGTFRWTHWFSAPLLVLLALHRSPFWDPNGDHAWIDFACGLFFGFAGTAHLLRGLSNPGRGLRRTLFLAAFAGTLTFLAVSTTTFGLGVVAHRDSGADFRFPANTWIGLLNWLALTALLAFLLHLLERYSAEAERQRALAAQAQEAVLRGRLAPHFIFNCLNTLKAQIGTDPAGAEATTDRLASLFRQVVQVSGLAQHSLAEELGFVETYLGIEKARMGSRLQVEIDVPEALEACPVLPLSLQVLVENAVKHGVAPLESGGTVRISASLDHKLLTLRVADPGPGIGSGMSSSGGTGTALDTLRQRLRQPRDLSLAMIDGRHCATLLFWL